MSGLAKVIWRFCSCSYIYLYCAFGAMLRYFIGNATKVYFYVGIGFFGLAILSVVVSGVIISIAKKTLPKTKITTKYARRQNWDLVTLAVVTFFTLSTSLLAFAFDEYLLIFPFFVAVFSFGEFNVEVYTLGYKFYDIENKDDSCVLITRNNHPFETHSCNVVEMFDGVYVEV